MGITKNVSHLLVILHLAPGILAGVVSNPGNARDAGEQIVCFGPDLGRTSVAFGFHTFNRRGFFGRGNMRACGRFERDEGKLQVRGRGAAELQCCGHRKWRWPNHGPQSVRYGEANTVSALKNPACKVKFYWKRVNETGIEICRIRTRVALRATLPGAGDHGYGTVGCII